MKKARIEGREQFQSSGVVNWVRFIPWSALAFLTAAVLAGVLYLLFKIGFYLVLLVPMLVAFGLAAVVALVVKKGHCRNRLVAALLGVVTGIVLYLGYYYIGMVNDLGIEHAGDISFLPMYVEFQVRNTVIKDVNAPDNEKQNEGDRPEKIWFNWAHFVLELGISIGLPLMAGLRWSQKLYCENCQDWMRRESTTFKPEVGTGMAEALRLNSPQSLAALFTSPEKPRPPFTAVAVNYCRDGKPPTNDDCAVYISIKQVKTMPQNKVGDAFDQAKGNLLARNVLLNQDEVAALLPRFKSLEKIAGITAAEALKDLNVEIKLDTQAKVSAEIIPVDPEFAKKILTLKNKLIGTGFVLAQFAFAFGSLLLALFGAMIAFPDHPAVTGVSPGTKLLGESMIGVFGICGIIGIALMLTRPDMLATRFLRKVAMRVVLQRPHPMVNPRDPGAGFMQVIPRANWGKLKLDDASDIGFLRVDAAKREVLFEGDNECYRIPGAAITSCEIEVFVAGQGTHGATKLYRMVLQVNLASGANHEIPFAIRGNTGKFHSKSREKWARGLYAEINAIVQKQGAVV